MKREIHTIKIILADHEASMEQDKHKELGDEQIYFLHQKNVEIINKTKKEIIKELNTLIQTPKNLIDMNNKDFNEVLTTTYQPFIGMIAYDIFVERRSEYEKTKKEVLERIEKRKQDEEIGPLIKMLEALREENINTTNFLQFFRIINLFIQKNTTNPDHTKDIKSTISDISLN